MTLLQMLASDAVWSSPAGPDGRDFYETYIGLAMPGSSHPPSLKNPQRVSTPDGTEGWRTGASKKSRQAALKRLAIVHQKVLNQIGRPAVAQTAVYPIVPSIFKQL